MIRVDWPVLIGLLVVLGLAVVDWLLGVLRAIVTGTLDLRLLPQQLGVVVLPLIGSLLSLALLQWLVDTEAAPSALTLPVGATFYAAASASTLKLVADIVFKVTMFTATPPPPTTASTATAPGVVPHG